MANDPYYVIRKSSNGQFYFTLKAGNGEPVATSETYTTKQSAERGVEACRNAARTLQVLDMTDK